MSFGTGTMRFRALFAMNFALTLGFGIVEAFFALFLRDLGAHGLTLGIAIGSYSAAKILFGPAMGKATDQLGTRQTVLYSLLLLLFISWLYPVVSQPFLIIGLRLLQGIGFALYRPAVQAMVAGLVGAQRRATGLGTFDVSFFGAVGLAPLVGGIIKDNWGFAGIFPTLCVLCLVALGALGIALAKSERAGTGLPLVKFPPVDLAAADTKSRQQPQRTFSGLLLYIFGRSCGIIIFLSFLPVFLLLQLQLNGTQTGLILAATTLITALILRPMGKLADILPRKMLVTTGGAGVAFCYLLIPSVGNFTEIGLLGIAIGVFSGMAQPASSALLIEEGGQMGTGFALGLFNTILNLGFFAGSLLGSLLQSLAGITSVFYGAGLLCLGGAMLFWVLSEPLRVPKRGGGETGNQKVV